MTNLGFYLEYIYREKGLSQNTMLAYNSTMLHIT